MSDNLRQACLTDLLEKPIFTSDNHKVGRVVDIELTRAAQPKITYLLSGRFGLLHRLHVLHPFARFIGVRVEADSFAWVDVARVEHAKIVMRFSYEHYRQQVSQAGQEGSHV